MNAREAMKIAKETAKEAGYKDATVTDSSYDEDDETYAVELEDNDTLITVSIDEKGEVLEFTTE